MPREDRFSDSGGQSPIPDVTTENEGAGRPTYSNRRSQSSFRPPQSQNTKSSILQKSAPALLTKPTFSSNASKRTVTLTPPTRRFRSAVHKIIAMQRGTDIMSHNVGLSNVGPGVVPGAEPGVDPRRDSADYTYGGIHQDCTIEIFDYSSVRSSFRRMSNQQFVSIMEDPAASDRERWARVRWINIGGMSWDVMKAVSIKYNLHPLALEDVFHARKQTRSKADYYPQHLFLHVLCHEAEEIGQHNLDVSRHIYPLQDSMLTENPVYDEPLSMIEEYSSDNLMDGDNSKRRKTKPDYKEELESSSGLNKQSRQLRSRFRKKRPSLDTRGSAFSTLTSIGDSPVAHQRRLIRQEEVALDALKNTQDRVKVSVTPIFIFLQRDGTVISIHPNSRGSTDFTSAITMRLHQRDTGLRQSADPSMLVHSILDLIVDKALEVADNYQLKIEKFERKILLSPEVNTVQNLHMLGGDLILLKRTMEPIKTLIYGLRRYDLDRCAAIAESEGVAKEKIVGYMSSRSKVYLADVYDHMDYILTSLEMFANISENLIEYAFNMTSYKMNQIMRQLMLVTVVFLPLTLLAGYFGMNFDDMWAKHRSDLFYWEVAIPVLLVVLSIFAFSDLTSIWHYLKKKVIYRNVIEKLDTE